MFKIGKFSVDKAAAIRILVLIIALVNQGLVAFGLSPMPFTTAEIEAGLSVVFTVIATFVATYKNNDFTPEAKKGTERMRELKADKKRNGGDK